MCSDKELEKEIESNLKLVGAKLKEKFDKLPPRKEINSYYCFDCDKDLGDLDFPDELKEKIPLSMNGKFAVICNECAENEDYSMYDDYI